MKHRDPVTGRDVDLTTARGTLERVEHVRPAPERLPPKAAALLRLLAESAALLDRLDPRVNAVSLDCLRRYGLACITWRPSDDARLVTITDAGRAALAAEKETP